MFGILHVPATKRLFFLLFAVKNIGVWVPMYTVGQVQSIRSIQLFVPWTNFMHTVQTDLNWHTSIAQLSFLYLQQKLYPSYLKEMGKLMSLKLDFIQVGLPSILILRLPLPLPSIVHFYRHHRQKTIHNIANKNLRFTKKKFMLSFFQQ